MNCMDKKCEWGKASNSPDGNIILCERHAKEWDKVNELWKIKEN